MTRINVIEPRELTDKHLLAEYRELPRIFTLVRRRTLRGDTPDMVTIPETYRLGTGHVTFFYDKLHYLIKRQHAIIKEMRNRRFTVNFDNPDLLLTGIPTHWHNDYQPTPHAIKLNRERINQRLTEAAL